MNTQITRIEQIVAELELFHHIAITYTNKALPTNAELLLNKSLADIEELTGEDSEASNAFASFQYASNRLQCGAKKSILAIPEPKIPFVLNDTNGTTVQTTEGGVNFANNRIRISSLELGGTFNDKITQLRLFSGLVHNAEREVGVASVLISNGDTAQTFLLNLANELMLKTKANIKPLLANGSFTKYRGVVADKTALLALATPTNYDFAHVTADNDFYFYKNGKWLKTYLGVSTPSATTIYFVQSHSGSTFNQEQIALHYYDKNSNLIDVAQNITTYSAGITTHDLKVGGVDANTSLKCIAGVGNLENIDADTNIVDLIFQRLSDVEKPYIYWNTDVATYKDKIVPLIRNKYNKVTDAQIGKDLAGLFAFPVIKPISGVDAMDDIYFDSIGEIRTGWENNAQIQLVRFSTHENENEHSDDLLQKPLYVKGIANAGGSIINYLISRGLYKVALLQDNLTNAEEILIYPKAGHIQNIAINDRYIKDGFINSVRSNVNMPFYEQLKSNKRNTNLFSTDIINEYADKYPFCFEEYTQENGVDGYILSSGRTLTEKTSALRKTNIQMIKLYFGWLANFQLKPVITNSAQGQTKELDIKGALVHLIDILSRNNATVPTASQDSILEPAKKTESIITIIKAVRSGKNIFDIKLKIFPTGELEGVNFTIITLNK